MVPNGVTLLSKKAFNGCSALESVTLPSGLAEIDERAFYRCTALKTINFCGTKAQWDNMTKGKYWDFQVESYTVICNYTENN